MPDQKKKISFTRKVTLMVASLILFFGSIATIGVYVLTRNELVDIREQGLLTSTFHIAEELNQIFTTSSDLSKTISANLNIVKLLENQNRSEEELDASTKLLENMNLGNNYLAIYVMDIDGLTIASTDPSFLGKNYSFRDYFVKAIAGKTWATVAKGITSKQVGYYFSSPIISSTGKIIGISVVKLAPAVIDKAVGDKVEHQNSEFMLVDEYGIIVSSSVKNRFLKSLAEFTPNSTEERAVNTRYGKTLGSLTYAPVLDVINNYQNTSMVRLYNTRDEKDETMTVSRINGLNFFLVTETDHDTIIATAKTNRLLIGGFVALAAFLASMLISILISRFLKPIQEIERVASEMARGNLDKRIKIISNDEIGSLAVSINKMVDSTMQARDDVDRKVKEQTQELERQKTEAQKARKEAEEASAAMTGRELKMIELKKEISRLKNSEK